MRFAGLFTKLISIFVYIHAVVIICVWQIFIKETACLLAWLSDINSAVILCIFLCLFLCVRLQISRRRWHWSAWNFARWYISVPDTKSPLLGRHPQGTPKSQISTANISKMASQMGRNISLTRAFQKCVAWDRSTPGKSLIRKNVYFLPGDRYLAPIGEKIRVTVELCPGRGFLHFCWRYL